MARHAAVPWWIWAGAGGLALVALSGGAVVAAKTYFDKAATRRLLRQKAEDYGVDPEIAEAIGKVESGWDPNALNCTGSDLARGCAVGATQITIATAQAYGFTGSKEALLASPETQAELTAKILADGNVSTASEAAAWWNAGRRSLLQAPSSTKFDYYPKLVAAQAYVRANPVV